MRLNPYTPISGMFPTYLAGREAMLNDVKEDLTRLQRNSSQQSVIYYGLRGVGKTVLLNLITDFSRNNDILTDYIDIDENGSFKNRISLCAQKFIVIMSPIVKDRVLAAKALSTLKAFQFTYGTNGIPVHMNPNIETFHEISDTSDFENDTVDLKAVESAIHDFEAALDSGFLKFSLIRRQINKSFLCLQCWIVMGCHVQFLKLQQTCIQDHRESIRFAHN